MKPAKHDVDLQDASAVCDVFERAAEAMRRCAGRRGSVVDLPEVTGRLVVSGDLHDHGENFRKLHRFAKLDTTARHHLILQELIHGEHLVNGMDFSYRMLARAAALKLAYPDQLHLLLSNHELAQVRGEGILKHGISVVDAFDRAIDFVFGDDAEHVQASIGRFVHAMPLAVRCGNGVMACHSLPSPRRLKDFDPAVLDRKPTDHDLAAPDGSVHLMVWGRHASQYLADTLAAAWQTQVFVLGHEPADLGWDTRGDSILIVNSDHDHAVAVEIDLSTKYDRDDLIDRIVPLNAIG